MVMIFKSMYDDVKGVKPISRRKRAYSKVYADMEELLSNPADIEKIYERYSGTTVTFPGKLYSHDYTLEYIEANYGKQPAGQIAKHLGITERRVRQIMQEIKEKKNMENHANSKQEAENKDATLAKMEWENPMEKLNPLKKPQNDPDGAFIPIPESTEEEDTHQNDAFLKNSLKKDKKND